jgi:hypothetical protein
MMPATVGARQFNCEPAEFTGLNAGALRKLVRRVSHRGRRLVIGHLAKWTLLAT